VNDLPRTGDVFWCKDFPGLHGNDPKDRYAVVISPPDKLPDSDGNYLVVPTSKSSLSQYKVPLPNYASHPQTTSGLPEPCDAVCDEYKLVKPSVLTEWKGDLRTHRVDELQDMVRKFIRDRREAKQAAAFGKKPS
jgi:mRNA-degrading endonuclease toxin of MazEF toxin-antitoxin module